MKVKMRRKRSLNFKPNQSRKIKNPKMVKLKLRKRQNRVNKVRISGRIPNFQLSFKQAKLTLI